MSEWISADEYGSIKMVLETEHETFDARIHQGGNGLWTAYVYRTTKGRKKKVGIGQIAGKVIFHEMMKPQSKTIEEAKIWAEEIWTEITRNL